MSSTNDKAPQYAVFSSHLLLPLRSIYLPQHRILKYQPKVKRQVAPPHTTRVYCGLPSLRQQISKFTLEQAMKALNGRRGIALLFL